MSSNDLSALGLRSMSNQEYAWMMTAGNYSMVDLLPKEMLPMIDEHWYQYKPLNPLWHSLLGVAMIVFGILAVVGNGIVLYLFGSTKFLRTPNNLLIMNLALSDFCMMVYMVPTMAFNCFQSTWVLGPFQCELYGMLGSLFGFVSIWSNVLITIDRYNVIVRGVGASPLTHKKAVLMNVVVWIVGTAWTILPLFGWDRYVPEGNMTTCGLDALTNDTQSLAYVIIYGIFVYFIPLCLFIYSYSYIVKAVSDHEKQLREQAKKMNVASLRANADQQKTSAECRLAKISITTTFLWFMAWTPYLLQTWGGVFSDGKYLTPLTTAWGSVFAKFSTCYNPIVYGISHPKYRQALFKKFPSLACGSNESDSDTKSIVSEMTTIDRSIQDKEAEATATST